MSNNLVERPRFYEGQYLGADDLKAAIDYSREQLGRHALAGHTWGIAAGLYLIGQETPAGGNQVDMFVQPGYAVDGFGRSIVVPYPYKIPAELFKSIPYDAATDDGDPEGRLVEVWLRYKETAFSGPASGFEVCSTEEQLARVQESFQIVIGEYSHSEQHDYVTVAGQSADAQVIDQNFDAEAEPVYDESIPYQDFPQIGDDRWLVPLGYVRWKPNPNPSLPGYFVTLEEDDKTQSRQLRQNMGVVGEGIHAVDEVIRLRQRDDDPATKVYTDDLVWVEGKLRADDDVRLLGSKLDFVTSNGEDDDTPLQIQRMEVNGFGGRDLRFVIGTSEEDNNRLAVGPVIEETFTARAVILDNGNVGIGLDEPKTLMHLFAEEDPTLKIQSNVNDDVSGRLSLRQKNETGVDLYYDGGSVEGLAVETFLSGASQGVKMLVSYVGNIGIGTTDPDKLLHLKGESDPTLKIQSDGNDEKSGRLSLRQINNTGTDIYYDGRNSYEGLAVETYASGSSNGVKLFVKNSGSVGIGTTSPKGTLDVRGNIKLGNSGDLYALSGEQNLRVIAGRVNSSGNPVSGTGFNSSRSSDTVGLYNISFPTAFSNIPVVVVSLVESIGNDHIGTLSNLSNSGFTVTTTDVESIDGSAGENVNNEFTFIAIGTR